MNTEPNTIANSEETEPDLLASISAWRYVIPVLGIIIVTAYFVYFKEQPAATDPDKWGTFGDYFGGLMNPIVAFAAFYWLTQSVKLQKQELKETRDELRDAANAQKALVANGQVQVQLAALTALAASASDELNAAKMERSNIVARRAGLRGAELMLFESNNAQNIARTQRAIERAQSKRDGYLKQMQSILNAHTPATPKESVTEVDIRYSLAEANENASGDKAS